MKNWRVELTAGRKSLTEIKIPRGIFKGDVLSPLLLVIAMMQLNCILKKYSGEYELHKSQEKINHQMYMDDIKLFAKNESELETLIQAVRIYNQDIVMCDTMSWIYAHTCIHTCVCAPIHVCMCIYIYTPTHMCVHTYTHTYIHTYIYTHTYICGKMS